MKARRLYSFISIGIFLAANVAFSSEKTLHHEPSITDLFYPAVNFVVLIGFMIWKLKKPMKEMFEKKAHEIQETVRAAAEKNKDAQEKLSSLQKKMQNLDVEIVQIKKDYEREIISFATALELETKATITRTEKDFENKLSGEENDLVEKLNEDLVNAVIAKTQLAIQGSTEMKNQATSKIVSQLR